MRCVTLCFLDTGGGTAGGNQAFFGQGTGDIWLDQVRCQGYERELFSCPSNALATEDCTHQEDAGVFCTASKSITMLNTWAGLKEKCPVPHIHVLL